MARTRGTSSLRTYLVTVFWSTLSGQMIAALGGIFVQGALEEVQGLVDLALELFLAEPKDFGLFAHKYAYILRIL